MWNSFNLGVAVSVEWWMIDTIAALVLLYKSLHITRWVPDLMNGYL